ncbi:MAG: hypothetical protein ABFS86_04205 [Planctomycetota bacterium]
MKGLLADTDFLQLVITVIVLVLIAVSTWVRKSFERMQQRDGAKPVDVGKAVREQLDKYMRAAGQLPPERPAPSPAPHPVPGDQAEPAPTPVPTREAIRDRPSLEPLPAMVVPERPKRRRLTPTPTVVKRVHRLSKFSPQDVKRAVVQAELLGPPMALRKDYRLF